MFSSDFGLLAMWIRFVIYGLLGWCFEIVWSAVTERAWGKQRDWRLMGHSYLWMFPIYGLLSPLGEPIHNLLRPHFWLLRGAAYLMCIWAVEYITGWLIKRITGKCPWDYSNFPGNFQGIITLEYAPVWFLFGLAFESVHDALVRLTPDICRALS
ncbi:MAG: putative ABC transporter permease [Terriglobia bacterium]